VFDLPDPPGAAGEQRELVARLRTVIGARDAELAALREGFGPRGTTER
jgi:hypothetical protein